jgi:hypothetical protein
MLLVGIKNLVQWLAKYCTTTTVPGNPHEDSYVYLDIFFLIKKILDLNICYIYPTRFVLIISHSGKIRSR